MKCGTLLPAFRYLCKVINVIEFKVANGDSFDSVFPLPFLYLKIQLIRSVYCLKVCLMRIIKHHKSALPTGCKILQVKNRERKQKQTCIRLQAELVPTIIEQGLSRFTNVEKRSIKGERKHIFLQFYCSNNHLCFIFILKIFWSHCSK